MLDGQDWCLQCGAGAPGSLAGQSSFWRSSGAILGATAILALAAAVAAYAALNKNPTKAHTVTIARVTPTPPVTSTPLTTPGELGTPGAIKPTLPHGTVKPPKIPFTAITPRVSGAKPRIPLVVPPIAKTIPPTTSATTPSSTGTGGSTTSTSEETQPTALLLDTNAASTYNPYNYPAGNFGDPSLAIDGDATTGWTAQVDPATAPKMAEGLLIDLRNPRKLATAVLSTSTPGMTVQLYGAKGHTMPASITDPAWVPLSPSRDIKKKHVRIKLRNSGKAFTFITLWISKAPATPLGTEQAPAHVSVDELELIPTS